MFLHAINVKSFPNKYLDTKKEKTKRNGRNSAFLQLFTFHTPPKKICARNLVSSPQNSTSISLKNAVLSAVSVKWLSFRKHCDLAIRKTTFNEN